MSDLTERRARFVYEAARLAAEAALGSVVPAPWDKREEPFRRQFRQAIERQCSELRSRSPEELHGSLVQAYLEKNSVSLALCEIARQWIK